MSALKVIASLLLLLASGIFIGYGWCYFREVVPPRSKEREE